MPRIGAAYVATALMLYVAGVDVEVFGAIGTLSKQVGVVIILFLGVYFILRKSTWRLGNFDERVAVVFLIFMLYGFVSIFWSFNEQATITAIFAWLYMASLCAILAGLDDEDCYRVLLNVTFVFCLAGIVRIFVGSEAFVVNQGVERFQGVFFGPHALAAPTALSLIILASGVVHQKLSYRLFYFLVIGSSLYLTFSRQALLAALIGVSLVLLLRLKSALRTRMIVLLVLAGLAFGILAELQGVASQEVLARGEGDDVATLTGRTLIWQAVIELILERPYLGYGFGAGGAALEEYYAAGVGGWRTFNAHNGFLQAHLDLGIIGMVIFLTLFLAFVRSAFFSRNHLSVGLGAAIFMITLVERGAYGLGGMVVTLYILLALRQSGFSNTKW